MFLNEGTQHSELTFEVIGEVETVKLAKPQLPEVVVEASLRYTYKTRGLLQPHLWTDAFLAAATVGSPATHRTNNLPNRPLAVPLPAFYLLA